MSSPWEFEIVGGPDAGRVIRLRRGRWSLGRVPGGLVVDDPLIEPHHVAVDVSGVVRCVQLAGRAPVLVDGERLAPFGVLSDGALIQVGASLVRLGRVGLTAAPPGRAGAARGWSVTLGVGDVSVSPRPELPFDRQVAFDARSRRDGVPIVADLARLDLLGLVGVHRRSVLRSIVSGAVAGSARPPGVVSFVSGLDGRDGSGQIVVCGTDDIDAARRAVSDGSIDDGRMLIVLADDHGRLPPGCRSRLEVGETWRGTFVADVATGFDHVVRLHVAGCSAMTAAARLGGSGHRAFVTEEVPRPGAEVGRCIIGVPQTA